MSSQDVVGELSRRAGPHWELYRKNGESHELIAAGASRRRAWRREEGWAARWWEQEGVRFACASRLDELVEAISLAQSIRLGPTPTPDWPESRSPDAPPAAEVEPPPELFADLARALSAESRGEGQLAELTLRRGVAVERIENGSGLLVTQVAETFDGVALAIGRRGSRLCEARVVFRTDGEPDVAAVARRLADRAVLPLAERSTPLARGEWLLDPSVASALLAALSPLFTTARPPSWLSRPRLASEQVTIVDDASADASFDGEGTATRRVPLVQSGEAVGRLRDLVSAAASGGRSTGHGVRPSYRLPPAVRPRRIFFETESGAPARDLLSSVKRGLFASALTAPVQVDLVKDHFEVEFTGVAVIAGRAQSPVSGARARGRLSHLLRRIVAVGTDRQFFPMPYPTGAPTLLIERADFD
ncbi:MAG TPA: metallopeptidase TldD-related protein [Thermoanaerobaculia bacterium]|nr:metallopeptidase TldD-related protein [Thermoanaerobaculia bacterium]